jgi:hypothetical protein
VSILLTYQPGFSALGKRLVQRKIAVEASWVHSWCFLQGMVLRSRVNGPNMLMLRIGADA